MTHSYIIYDDDLLTTPLIADIINQCPYRFVTDIADHPSAQCWVWEYYDINHKLRCEILQSYATLVCAVVYTEYGAKLFCNGTYSTTTRKHIGYFAKRIGGNTSYYDFKNVIEQREDDTVC